MLIFLDKFNFFQMLILLDTGSNVGSQFGLNLLKINQVQKRETRKPLAYD